RARGLEVPGPEGLAGDPTAGSRDAAADVPHLAQPDRQGLDDEAARHGLVVRNGSAHRLRVPELGTPALRRWDRESWLRSSRQSNSGLTSAARQSSPMSRSTSPRASSWG